LEAIAELERINGRSIKLSLEKSAIMQELNKIDEAIKLLVEVHNPDSANINIVERLVSMYLETENFIDADIFNKILLNEFSDSPSGYINAAIISLNNDMPEKAIKYIEPVIDKYDNNYSALYLLGTSFFQIKDLLNAEKYLKQSLKIYPQSRTSKHTLAMIYDQTGVWIKSDSLYFDLINSDSTDAQAYNNFAYSLVERKANLELALEMSLIATRIEPGSAPYLDTLGWIYYNLEQYEKALEHVQKSYSIDAENPVIVEHLADILKATDQVSKANLIYMQAINIGGDSLSIQQKINIE
jgi:tetratricopeptide (TPR) repeat protein